MFINMRLVLILSLILSGCGDDSEQTLPSPTTHEAPVASCKDTSLQRVWYLNGDPNQSLEFQDGCSVKFHAGVTYATSAVFSSKSLAIEGDDNSLLGGHKSCGYSIISTFNQTYLTITCGSDSFSYTAH